MLEKGEKLLSLVQSDVHTDSSSEDDEHAVTFSKDPGDTDSEMGEAESAGAPKLCGSGRRKMSDVVEPTAKDYAMMSSPEQEKEEGN